MFLPHPRVKVCIVGSLRDREVVCSASDRQGSNFESCVWRTVSSQSSHHPQEVLLAQFSLYVHKGGLKPDSKPDNFLHFSLDIVTVFSISVFPIKLLRLQRQTSVTAYISSEQSLMFAAANSSDCSLEKLFFPAFFSNVAGIVRCRWPASILIVPDWGPQPANLTPCHVQPPMATWLSSASVDLWPCWITPLTAAPRVTAPPPSRRPDRKWLPDFRRSPRTGRACWPGTWVRRPPRWSIPTLWGPSTAEDDAGSARALNLTHAVTVYTRVEASFKKCHWNW